ncbi:MAG: hypothetical protein DLM59_15890 [Pseudonocardiales bacterium]|nr:MAG: hypothetical protein DLM59_15890 [Pseudonocardiales bacterium]
MSGPALRVLSLGAGVQSTALALLAVEGVLPRPDAVIFADTGWEPAAVYTHLDRLEPVLAAAGMAVYRVSAGNIRADALNPAHRFASMPLHVIRPDGGSGMIRRQCTSEYKVKPIKAKVRELLGYAHPRPVPTGVWAEQWIGFSTDELGRVRDRLDVNYTRPVYPLLDLGMSRTDCQRFLGVRGWSTTKSACVGCPFHGNQAWRALRDSDPSGWADAVAFDAAIRHGHPHARTGGDDLLGRAYLHRSRLPLAVAPIDRVTRREHADRQTDLLDAIADHEAGYHPDDQGDPDGCSPYGCRSGGPT